MRRRAALTVLTALAIAALVLTGGLAIGRYVAQRSDSSSPAPNRSEAAPPETIKTRTQVPPSRYMQLSDDFGKLLPTLNADVGIAIGAVGLGEDPLVFGEWGIGPAWSTIKVPLALAALRNSEASEASPEMIAAITKSDNTAAEALWQGLGDPQTAAQKVQAVLRETGDQTVVESRKIRPEYSAFGQTNWSLTEQVRFLSVAACESRNEPIFALMGQISDDQRWGIGKVPETRFKGGWGPSPEGAYLVRQMGIVSTPSGKAVVALAAEPNSGEFADAMAALTTLADWIASRLVDIPAGSCGNGDR